MYIWWLVNAVTAKSLCKKLPEHRHVGGISLIIIRLQFATWRTRHNPIRRASK